MSYQVELIPQDNPNGTRSWETSVGIGYKSIAERLQSRLQQLHISDDQEMDENNIWVSYTNDTLDDDFCGTLAKTLCSFVESITPIVREYMDEEEEEKES